MILNHEEIRARQIIISPVESEFGDGSYNLTVEKVIDMNNNINNSFTLKPQGMVYVVFKERLQVPSDVIGFAHVKTTLTKLGIMATNIGIIDPNYNGYISTLLINFGKSEHRISQGDAALRVTFAMIDEPKLKKPLNQNNKQLFEYYESIQKNITHLDEKFLNLNSVQSDVEKSVFISIRNYVGLFTVGSFLIASIFQLKSCSDRNDDNVIKNYESAVSTVQENNKLLQEKLDRYEMKLESLKDSLSEQSKEIKKIKVNENGKRK